MLLIIVTMLYIRFSKLLHLTAGSLYALANISPQPLESLFLWLLLFPCMWEHRGFTFPCLTYFGQHNALKVQAWSLKRQDFLLCPNNRCACVCMWVIHFFDPSIPWRTLRLFACFGSGGIANLKIGVTPLIYSSFSTLFGCSSFFAFPYKFLIS